MKDRFGIRGSGATPSSGHKARVFYQEKRLPRILPDPRSGGKAKPLFPGTRPVVWPGMRLSALRGLKPFYLPDGPNRPRALEHGPKPKTHVYACFSADDDCISGISGVNFH
ncbi:MAG: hypothetical protein Kow00105_03990 [Phycisphaeraceae bacterium]